MKMARFMLLGLVTVAVLTAILPMSVALAASETVTSANSQVLEAGYTYIFDPFVFTTENTGSLKTIKGNQVQYHVQFKSTDPSQIDPNLYVAFYNAGGKRFYYGHYYYVNLGTNSLGYVDVTSDWFDIVYGEEYYMFYQAIAFWSESHLYPMEVCVEISVR